MKKQTRPFQVAIEDEVERIVINPDMGRSKKGDLVRFRVEKFSYRGQKFLIAYHLQGHEFDEIRQKRFTIKEEAVYLEAAEITVRRRVKPGKIKYTGVGRNTVFDPDELKAFKSHKA